MAMEGESITDIMLQGFWKSPKTALHYIGLLKAVVGKEFMEALERSKDGRLLKVASDKEIGTLGQSYIFRKVSQRKNAIKLKVVWEIGVFEKVSQKTIAKAARSDASETVF